MHDPLPKPDEQMEVPGAADGLRVTLVGLVVNLLLIGLKFWGGIVGRSQALIADAVHSTSDLFSDLVVYFGLRIGRKQADEQHPYGHGRIETIASLIVGVILVLVAGSIAYSAATDFYEHRSATPTALALVVAVVSILSKELLYWYTLATGRRLRSAVLIGNAWHHRSDAFSSVAVLLGLIAIRLNPDWYLADTVAAIVVAAFVFKVGYSLSRDALLELADTAPHSDIVARIRTVAEETGQVLQVHGLKARLSGPSILVEMHVVVDSSISVHDGHEIAELVKQRLLDDLESVTEVLVHIEPDTEIQ